MNIKLFGRNIAAVSLIEIMMIFTIIGVVTTACVSLAKPKYEYMKKIKVYAAFDMLENAAKILQSEGSIDFTTDINTCKDRNNSTNYCNDYNGQYPHISNQLPKAAYRPSNESTTTLNKTIYKNFNGTEKSQFVNLQKGLCERLQKVINTNGYKQQSCSTSNLIDDSNPASITVANYFKNKTPQLILPNGNALYMSKHLYTDYGTTRNIVNATTQETSYNDSTEKVAMGTSPCNQYTCPAISSYVCDMLGATNSTLRVQPNETRLAGAERAHDTIPEDAEQALKLYARNKDYFVIYVDTNCQWNANSDSKLCGPDTLNNDVFAFRMYRDGTVIPDPSSSFPSNMLTARVLIQQADTIGFNNMYGNYKVSVNYANLPLNAARCYANLMCNGINNHSICSICNNYANVTTPLSECVINNGDTKCKVIINKPSFIMR